MAGIGRLVWRQVESRLGEYLDFNTKEDGEISLKSKRMRLQNVGLKPEAIRRLLGKSTQTGGDKETPR